MVNWSYKFRKYYENKGYKFTNYKEKFEVCFEDIHPGSGMQIVVICDYCGKDFKKSVCDYNRIVDNKQLCACQKCSGIKVSASTLNMRQDMIHDDIMAFCKKNDYQLITEKHELINNQSMVSYICPIHGETKARVTSMRQGKRCYKCSRQTALKKKAETTLKDRQESLFSRALEVAKLKGYHIVSDKGEIQTNISKIIYTCSDQGHGKQSMRISNFITGRNCPKCSAIKSVEKMKLSSQEAFDRVQMCGGYLLNKDDYKGIGRKNLRILCPNCKKEFVTSLQNFIQRGGQVCSDCSCVESNGERRIRNFLTSKNVYFVQEKWFANCRDINPLPFDFYLPELNMCIEFDGRQHYVNVDYFSYDLDTTKKHDEIKNKYCLNSKIKLLRIPYWDYDNIETILNETLN